MLCEIIIVSNCFRLLANIRVLYGNGSSWGHSGLAWLGNLQFVMNCVNHTRSLILIHAPTWPSFVIASIERSPSPLDDKLLPTPAHPEVDLSLELPCQRSWSCFFGIFMAYLVCSNFTATKLSSPDYVKGESRHEASRSRSQTTSSTSVPPLKES